MNWIKQPLRWISLLLLLSFVGLQYRLWIGQGSWEEVVTLRQAIAAQKATNERLEVRNQVLASEVRDLKSGLDSVEERARSELGLIREGETFYILADESR